MTSTVSAQMRMNEWCHFCPYIANSLVFSKAEWKMKKTLRHTQIIMWYYKKSLKIITFKKCLFRNESPAKCLQTEVLKNDFYVRFMVSYFFDIALLENIFLKLSCQWKIFPKLVTHTFQNILRMHLGHRKSVF